MKPSTRPRSGPTPARPGVTALPIEVPPGPGGADRGRAVVPGAPCYFCEAVAGRTEKAIVEETALTLTLVNWKQYELGQVYVIPRRHAPTLFDLTDEEAAAVMRTVRRIAGALVRAYDPDGLNLIQNNGVAAGQQVPHFHVHVVPRRRVGGDWGDGPPHIAALEGKTRVKPSRDVTVSVEEEHEIARRVRRFLVGPR